MPVATLDSPGRVLAVPVALHDPLAHPRWTDHSPEWRSRQQCDDPRCIHDVDAWVQAGINRFQKPTARRIHRIELSEHEREELALAGIQILYDLHRKYEPHMAGYQQAGSFSGYAAMYWPRKTGDAWHRLHPEHQLRTQPDGGRRWHYGERAISLEALTAEDPDRHTIMASTDSTRDLATRLHRALVDRSRRDLEWVVRVAKQISRGVTPAAAAETLGLTEEIVRRHMRTIVRAEPTPGHQFLKVSELRTAVERLADRDAETAARVGELLSQGATVGDIADVLSIETGEVRDHEDAIRRVWHHIESEG